MSSRSSTCRIGVITLLPFVMILISYHGWLHQSIINASPSNGTPNDNEFIDLKLESEPSVNKFYCGTLDFALHSLTHLQVIEPQHINIKMTPFAIASCGDEYSTYILRDCKLHLLLNKYTYAWITSLEFVAYICDDEEIITILDGLHGENEPLIYNPTPIPSDTLLTPSNRTSDPLLTHDICHQQQVFYVVINWIKIKKKCINKKKRKKLHF